MQNGKSILSVIRRLSVGVEALAGAFPPEGSTPGPSSRKSERILLFNKKIGSQRILQFAFCIDG
jgi:hypothetical protein